MTAPDDDEARLAEEAWQAEIERRKAYQDKLWLDQLTSRGDWSYAEALLWVVFRDYQYVAIKLDFGRDKLCSDDASMVVALVSLMGLQDKASAEQAPEAALSAAVTRGSITGGGLDRASWEIGRLIDPARAGARFDRVSVVATFPPELAPEQSAAPAIPATPPRNKSVAARAKFSAVVNANPGGPPDEWRKAATIETLVREFGLTDAEASAARTRVLDEAAPEVGAKWRTAGAPKKSVK